MPFYEYQCSHCAHRLEVLQKISDAPLVYCPECNEATLKKLVSAAAFRLKGTGWYETDFKGNGKGQEKSADGKSPDSSADTSTDKSSDKGESLSNKTEGKKSDSAAATGANSASAGVTA